MMVTRSLFAALALVSLAACSDSTPSGEKQWPISKDELVGKAPAEQDQGELSYRRYCIGCHGSDGHGNGGITGADLAAASGPLSTRSDSELMVSVRDGKTGKLATMPAHRPVLNDAQIAAVVGYVRKQFGPK